MGGHPEAALPPDRADRPLEFLVVEGDEPPAVAAEKVVVMLAAGPEPLKARGAPAEVQSLEEAEALELFECPVHAGPADLGQAAVDVRRGQGAGLAGEEGDDSLAGRTAAPARAPQGTPRVVGPGLGGGGVHPAEASS